MLLVTINPHHLLIGIQCTHHPALQSREDSAMAHVVLLEPVSDLLQIGLGPHPPRDGIPEFLFQRLLLVVADFDDDFVSVVLHREHHGEELVLVVVVVPLGLVLAAHDVDVEVAGLLDVGGGEFEVVDSPELWSFHFD